MRRFSNTFAFWGDCRLLFPISGDFLLLILWFWGDFRKLIPFVSSSQFVIPNLFCPNRTRLLTLSSTIKTILWYNIYEYSIRKFHFFVYWCICIFYFIYLSVVQCTYRHMVYLWLYYSGLVGKASVPCPISLALSPPLRGLITAGHSPLAQGPYNKDLYRRQGKGRRCYLGDIIYPIPCHASYFAPEWYEEKDKWYQDDMKKRINSSYFANCPGAK